MHSIERLWNERNRNPVLITSGVIIRLIAVIWSSVTRGSNRRRDSQRARKALPKAPPSWFPIGSLLEGPRLYKPAEAGEGGRFRFLGIAPGKYRLFAWEELEPGA